MFHKIKEVIPMEELTLKIIFENGKIKSYDIEQLINKIKAFEKLRDKKLFNKVRVDQGGYGISWDDELDLECTELWENGKWRGE